MNLDRFDQLVREHLPQMLRLAMRLCGDATRAEDVIQEALLRATRSWSTFRGEATFRTWVYRLTVNVWRDEMRRRVRPGPLMEDLDDTAATSPVEDAAGRELGEIVAMRVSALPPRQREVLVLMAYEGHSADEAAAVLGISAQNVRTTLHLARSKLREQLARYLDVDASGKRND